MEIHSNARLTADDISRIAPDTVVVATGAIPPPGPVGSKLQGPRCISIDDALYFGASKSVVVFDQNGTNEPAFVAEELAGRKHRVTFVTPFEVMAPYVAGLRRVAAETAWSLWVGSRSQRVGDAYSARGQSAMRDADDAARMI